MNNRRLSSRNKLKLRRRLLASKPASLEDESESEEEMTQEVKGFDRADVHMPNADEFHTQFDEYQFPDAIDEQLNVSQQPHTIQAIQGNGSFVEEQVFDGPIMEDMAAVREELLIFLHKWIQRSRSDKELEELFEMSRLIYGIESQPCFSANDVRATLKLIKSELFKETVVICKICGHRLRNQNALCSNGSCPKKQEASKAFRREV